MLSMSELRINDAALAEAKPQTGNVADGTELL
jgi:hypothetical protein